MKGLIVSCCAALGAAIPFACGSSVNADGIAPVSVAPAEAEYKSNAAALGQAGNSSVYQFDITTGSGRLTINLAEQRFVFKGKGFEPNKTYSLQYTVDGDDAVIHVLASGVATPTGKLDLDGTWTGDSSILSAAAFAVSAPSAGGILTTVTVWGAGTDSCLGPYVYAGLFAITSPPVPLGVGSVLGLSPTGTIEIVCDRYVQNTSLIVNGTAYGAYMFPARSMCPVSAPTCP